MSEDEETNTTGGADETPDGAQGRSAQGNGTLLEDNGGGIKVNMQPPNLNTFKNYKNTFE